MKEMVLDDRFIAETFGNWDFGPDFTGDLMTMKNLEHFRAKYANQRLHLVCLIVYIIVKVCCF